MLPFALFLLTFFSSFILAQDVPSSAPRCVRNCFNAKLREAAILAPSTRRSNVLGLCASEAFVRAYNTCLTDNCSPQDVVEGQAMGNRVCDAAAASSDVVTSAVSTLVSLESSASSAVSRARSRASSAISSAVTATDISAIGSVTRSLASVDQSVRSGISSAASSVTSSVASVLSSASASAASASASSSSAFENSATVGSIALALAFGSTCIGVLAVFA